MPSLIFYDSSLSSCLNHLNQIENLESRRILFHSLSEFSVGVINGLGNNHCAYATLSLEAGFVDTNNVSIVGSVSENDILIINESDTEKLSDLLLTYVDSNIQIFAPITSHYYLNRPLFLITLPKGGTHLLYRLAEALGYQPAVVYDGDPMPGNWYCVEYSNSHTVAKDFFIDSVRRAPFGNRHHPFPRTPTLFIYRNPLDVVVSEANYYHRDGATVFSSYLRRLPFEGRLLRLINDTHLLGSIRDRINNFVPWFDCENVIPVSFEELVGDKGGGDNELRDQLIWSLQLKLHIPGSPKELGAKIFDENSPTFNEGRIGSSKEKMHTEALISFFSLNLDFMRLTGYIDNEIDQKNIKNIWQNVRQFSSRIDEFKYRPLRTSVEDFSDTPFVVEWNFLGHNIVRFNKHYYAISQSSGPVNLFDLRANNQLSLLISSTKIDDIKSKIVSGVNCKEYCNQNPESSNKANKRFSLFSFLNRI